MQEEALVQDIYSTDEEEEKPEMDRYGYTLYMTGAVRIIRKGDNQEEEMMKFRKERKHFVESAWKKQFPDTDNFPLEVNPSPEEEQFGEATYEAFKKWISEAEQYLPPSLSERVYLSRLHRKKHWTHLKEFQKDHSTVPFEQDPDTLIAPIDREILKEITGGEVYVKFREIFLFLDYHVWECSPEYYHYGGLDLSFVQLLFNDLGIIKNPKREETVKMARIICIAFHLWKALYKHSYINPSIIINEILPLLVISGDAVMDAVIYTQAIIF